MALKTYISLLKNVTMRRLSQSNGWEEIETEGFKASSYVLNQEKQIQINDDKGQENKRS